MLNAGRAERLEMDLAVVPPSLEGHMPTVQLPVRAKRLSVDTWEFGWLRWLAVPGRARFAAALCPRGRASSEYCASSRFLDWRRSLTDRGSAFSGCTHVDTECAH